MDFIILEITSAGQYLSQLSVILCIILLNSKTPFFALLVIFIGTLSIFSKTSCSVNPLIVA